MYNIMISESKEYFTIDGKPFFYLADTVWSAFTNVTLEEWDEYLEYRRMQGFNALQINILPQWDRSRSSTTKQKVYPFKTDAEGNIDFYALNEDYFNRAARMTVMAADKGFVPSLVLLWGDYVENPWACSLKPCRVFPLEAVEPYVEYVTKVFSDCNPIYLVSGDNDFKYESTHPYFLRALRAVKSACPHAITTLHMSGEDSELPEIFVQSEDLDVYMYQSGHSTTEQCIKPPYKLAMDFYKKSRKKPIINGEPCYEGIGFWNRYGRFGAFHVRKAIWQSLLSGAKAGVTYGAHGIWSWHNKGDCFPSAGCFNEPYDWRTALCFRGAHDAVFAKWMFETYQLFDIEPVDLILNDTEEIRVSVSIDNKIVVFYIPYNTEVKTSMDLHGYDWTLIALEERIFAKPLIRRENDAYIIQMHNYNEDVLIIGRR